MSTLRASTVETSSGGPVTLTKQSAAKAYIDVPNGIASINKSLNVSTLTDAGVGDGAVNFTNNFDSTFYAIATACNDHPTTTSIMYAHDISHGTQLSSSYDFEVVYWNASNHRTNGDIRSHSQLVGDLA